MKCKLSVLQRIEVRTSPEMGYFEDKASHPLAERVSRERIAPGLKTLGLRSLRSFYQNHINFSTNYIIPILDQNNYHESKNNCNI